MRRLLLILYMAACAAAAMATGADTLAVYEATMDIAGGSGDFAPFYLASNRFGMMSSNRNVIVSAKAVRPLDSRPRFSYGFGVEAAGGYCSAVDYDRYYIETHSWGRNRQHPPRVWLQQLYGEVKWRSLFLSVGMKEREPVIVDRTLSSGDLVESGNSRPVPQARAGFIDYQPVPFTRGFLQVQGEFAYGKMADASWWSDHSDRYNSWTASGVWYVYRRLYFRTDASRRVSFTFGAQAASFFGGNTVYLHHGEIERESRRGVNLGDFFAMIIPVDKGGEDFVRGSSLGSWDIRADIRLPRGARLAAYVEFPWEDGSGMGKLNGWDGLYGIELTLSGRNPVLKKAVLEYLDLTNQSGPIHYAPDDYDNPPVLTQATGADDYYNNKYYNSYANYGMIIGTPMVMSPIYNRDGYMNIIANRVRGFHAGAQGCVSSCIDWKVMFSHRKAFGNGFTPLIPALKSTSAYAGIDWRVKAAAGLKLGASVAVDRGDLPANAFAAQLSVSYTGIIPFKK